MPTITPGVTPISFSDWDNLYNTLLAIIGPIAVDNTGKPLLSSRGNGYGLTSSFLNSAPYPFTKTITTISRTNPGVVSTGTVNHGFQNGDIVYLSGLPGAWSSSSLEGQYFEVTNRTDTTFALKDTFLAASGLPTFAGTGTVTQPIVHKSQFDRIKLDLDAVFQHIFATNSGTTAPTRNTTIQGSVYNQYYTAIDQSLSKKLVLRTFDEVLAASRTQTGTWGDGAAGLDAEFSITFPDELKFFQYWNTGGMIRFGITIANQQTSGQQAAKESSWTQVINDNFPMYYPGFTKTIMGYDSTTFAPGRTTDTNNFTDEGAFTSASIGFTQIYEKRPTSSTYTSNYIRMEHFRTVGNPAQIQFKLFLQDQVNNAFTGGVTADITFTISLLYTKTPIPLSWDPSTQITISFTNNI
jgi:hypothetical protein